MSDPPRVILLDSNAYFRLARTIHPLLAGTFGVNPVNSLYVLSDLDDEYSTNPRLRTKFEWVREARYQRDRSAKRYAYGGKLRKQVENAFSFLVAYAREQAINLSREDLKALAVGLARGIPVVGDDAGMGKVAEVHGIEYWGVLRLLHLMVSSDRIDMNMVKQLLQYLDQENDPPMPRSKLRAEFNKCFGTACPI